MVPMAQSSANWLNTCTHMDRMHSLTHLHQNRYNHVVRSASSAIAKFGIKFCIYQCIMKFHYRPGNASPLLGHVCENLSVWIYTKL